MFFLITGLYSNLCAGSQGRPGFTLSSLEWNIGKIDRTFRKPQTLEIYNKSGKPLSVSARATCDCLTVEPLSLEIPPGKKAGFKIIFDPSTMSGKIRHSVYIETGDSATPFVNYMMTADVSESFNVYFFYDRDCGVCENILSKLDALAAKMNFRVKRLAVSKPRNFEYLRYFEKTYGIKSSKFPVLVAGGAVLSGEGAILSGMEKALANFSAGSEKASDFENSAAAEASGKGLSSLKFLPVVSAALIDGINPCAFAGIIFLVSYMSFILRKPRKDVLIFGAGYSAGVCFFYFLFGLGLLKAIRMLETFHLAARIFYFLLAALTAVLAVLSIRDIFLFGSTGDMSLKVPEKLREKMKKTASGILKRKEAFFYFFLIGGLVSSFELVCTGQVYLPTISYLVTVTNYSPTAVGALFAYSVIFTLPLLAVFYFVYRGSGSVAMVSFMKRNVVKAKIGNALLFAFFAIYLFFKAFG